MDPNLDTEQKHVVVSTPGQRTERFTEKTFLEPENTGLTTVSIAIIAIFAVAAIAVVAYLVVNKNDNEAANRNANVAAASQASATQPPVIVQQPAQQAPVIIQQPATQQAPVIIQQPAEPESEHERERRCQNAGHCYQAPGGKCGYDWSRSHRE
jgi:hypothetical protein